MYTHFQRFVATVLLFSLLLQSCGNPNWKIADDAPPKGTSTKTYHPAKVKQRSVSLALATAESVTESSMEPKAEGTPAPTPVHSPVVNAVSQRPAPSSPSRSSSATSERKQSIEKKPQHVVLDKESIARRKGTPLATSRTVAPVVAARPTQPQALQPTSSLPAERLHPVASRQPQQAIKATERKASHLKLASSPALQPYPSAQGHQVRFQEANGKWLAQVQDGWGRAQVLPVVCAPDQSPTQALQKLASKSPSQHKYWVHVLETNQTPWAPRVVYVGALGVRGGGNSSSSDHGSLIGVTGDLEGNMRIHAVLEFLPSAL